MKGEIRYRSSVEKDVSKLPDDVRRQVFRVIGDLTGDPFPSGCKKLKGARSPHGARFRIRVASSYRIVYSVFKGERLIRIEFVGHRKDAYRWF